MEESDPMPYGIDYRQPGIAMEMYQGAMTTILASLIAGTFYTDSCESLESYGLACILSRPWFSRRWILQEAVLPPRRTCYIGTSSFDFSSILYSAAVLKAEDLHFRLIHRYRMIEPSSTVVFLHTRLTCQYEPFGSAIATIERRQAEQIYYLLTCCAGDLRTSEKRDVLYALLGMVEGSKTCKELMADYGKSLSQFYRDIAVYFIRQGVLQFLSACPGTDPNLPSWVPTWDVPHHPIESLSFSNRTPPILSTCGNILNLQAISLGLVVFTMILTEQNAENGLALGKWLESIHSMIEESCASNKLHQNIDSIRKSFGHSFAYHFLALIRKYDENLAMIAAAAPRDSDTAPPKLESAAILIREHLEYVNPPVFGFVQTGFVTYFTAKEDVSQVIIIPGTETGLVLSRKTAGHRIVDTCVIPGFIDDANIEQRRQFESTPQEREYFTIV
jgi:hypothetical protein